jgi:hypothetical protein
MNTHFMISTGGTLTVPPFIDLFGITHEALFSHVGTISLCGRLKETKPYEADRARWVHASISPRPTSNVDCMTCMITRIWLDEKIALEKETAPGGSFIEFDLRIMP